MNCFISTTIKLNDTLYFNLSKKLLEGIIIYFFAGMAEWLSRWPRDPKNLKKWKNQVSQ